ncbi:MAG TPA: ceramidase domain-containing protein [Longimicrobiales bacterium]
MACRGAAAASFLITIVIASPWQTWRPATCMPAACFCEAAHDTLIRQPVNAWSSLAFAGVAGAIVWQGVRISRRDSVQWFFVSGLLWVAVGSAFFHASLTYWGQFADVSGMYVLAVTILLARAQQHRGMRARTTAGLFLVLNAVLLWLLWTAPFLRRYLFAGIIIAIVVQEWGWIRARGSSGSARWLYRSLALLAIGFLFWTVDLLRLVCAPHSLAQGHALWHVLGASAAGLVYVYLRTDPARP